MFVLPVSTPPLRSALRRPLPAFGILAADDASSTRTPRLDVLETDGAYSVALDMPGVAREQLDVRVVGRRIEVSTRPAEAAAEAAPAGKLLYRERGTAPYARSIVLPEEVDSAQTQARLDNGVLRLTLPKCSAAASAKILVS